MRILPIAERELRVASRQRGTYGVRLGAAGMAIGAAGSVLLTMMRESPAEQGQALFVALTVLAFGYCLLAGVLTTSDCVSEEKREGTLGLLFLTSLRGHDVVVGKTVASSARAIAGLLALLPVIGLPLLLGGVSPAAVGSMAMVLLNTLFLSLAFGVFSSVLARDSRQAVGGTVLGLLFLLALLPLGRWAVVEYLVRPAPGPPGANPAGSSPGEPWGWLLLGNPLVPFGRSLDVLLRGRSVDATFWRALGVQHALGWLAMVGACVLLPRVWQDRPETGAAARQLGRTRARARARARRRWRDAVLARNPFTWLIARDRRTWAFTWLGIGVLGGFWAWGYAEVGETWFQGIIGFLTFFFGALWLKVRTASIACRTLHEQGRSGALELLLCTPLAAAGVLRGNLLGLRRAMVGPLVAVLAGGAVLLGLAVGEDPGFGDGTEWIAFFGVGAVILLLDMYTLAWTGTWQGLRSRRYVRGYAVALIQVLALPWILFLASVVVATVGFEAMAMGMMPVFDSGYGMILAWWALLAVGVDAWLLAAARRRLRMALAGRTGGEAASSSAGGLAGRAARSEDRIPRENRAPEVERTGHVVS